MPLHSNMGDAELAAFMQRAVVKGGRRVPKYEDPSEDPAIIEAIVNIQQAIREIARIWEYTQNDHLAGAQADLEQAVRFLRGEEVPE